MNKVFLMLVSVSFLIAGIPSAQGSSSPAPSELLALAVAQTQLCGYVPVRREMDEDHQSIRIVPDIEKEEQDIASKLSLRTLFRPGRFKLDPEVHQSEV